jgi:histidinol-phosphate aminotransferase
MRNNSKIDFQRLVPGFVQKFEPYIPSKPDQELMKLYGCDHLFRLNNNENPLGAPKKAQEILDNFNPLRLSVYPSGDSYYLRNKIADIYNLNPDQILVGNGANEAISFVIKAFCQEGDNIITADKTFSVYEWIAQFSGFEAKLIPLKNFGYDDFNMLEQIDNRTKIIFICNPNNPTGTYWNEEKVRNFLNKVDSKQIVVLDEAYFEFVEKSDFPDGIKLIKDYPNLIVFRTFSKMYGLAALRVGYLIGNLSVVDIIRKTCVVYSVNSIAQEVASIAIDDNDHLKQTRNLIEVEKKYLENELSKMGLQTQIAEGCYIMIKLPFSDTLAYRKLMSFGIMIRSMTGFRFPNWIRVSIGKHEAMESFVGSLKNILSDFKV